MTLDKEAFPATELLVTQELNTVDHLYTHRIVVLPAERKQYIMPFAELCYNSLLHYHKGPKFFAQILWLSFDFRKNEHSEESLSVDEIDFEIQKLKRLLFE